MKEIEKFCVRQEMSVREALKRLQETAEGVLLLLDERHRLIRTVTDGDIRRLLLSGFDLTAGLVALPHQDPVTAPEDIDPAEALSVLNTYRVDQLPLVTPEGRVTGLYLRRDLDRRILLSTPHLGPYEMEFIEEAFRTNWIAPLGPNVDAFEREFASCVGVDHATALSSGTAALHLALRVLGVGPGDMVLCSTLTFVASANPILYQGATPVFIDSDPATWNMSAEALARAFSDARSTGAMPKAVIVVNLYGQSADLDPILELCRRHDVPVIEDAAESLGATYKGRQSGTLGRLGFYSFNGNKIITTSGGGMLVSSDAGLIEKARVLSMQAREPCAWYEHKDVGYNYRMSNILAGIGRGQLKVLDERVRARRAIFDRYREGLRDVEALSWMPEASFGRSTRWLSVCRIDPASGINPVDMISSLQGELIEARHVWKPMHRQPMFTNSGYYEHAAGRSFSDVAFATGVCLPSGSNMSEAQQYRVIRAIRSLFQSRIPAHA